MHISPRSPAPHPPFDAGALRQERGQLSQLLAWLFAQPATMWLMRRCWPLPHWGGKCLVARYDDVCETLSRPDVFRVPWDDKMELLAPSTQRFVLGTDDAAAHSCGQRRLMQVFLREDVLRTADIAARASNHVVGGTDGEIDGLKDLIATVSLAIYRDYYGLRGLNGDFMLWLMAISTYTFTEAGPNLAAKSPAVAAAARVAEAMDSALALARREPASDTIAARLVRLQAQLQAQKPGVLPDDVLRSMLTGMLLGFGSTLSMAGASILEFLLRSRTAMAAATRAARDGDDEALGRCLLEALRLNPIGPGIWRVCARDHTIAAGTPRATRVRQGEAVFILLQSAMRDADRVRDAGRFDPDRPSSDSMVYGYGMHWCTGAPLATATLTQILKPLLLRGFGRAPCGRSRIRRFGSIPERMSLLLGPR